MQILCIQLYTETVLCEQSRFCVVNSTHTWFSTWLILILSHVRRSQA